MTTAVTVAVAAEASTMVVSAVKNMGEGHRWDPELEGENKKPKQEVTSNKGNIYDNTPSNNHTKTTENPGSKGKPNSSVDIIDEAGNVKTRRWFDENGNATRDLDMTDHGNSKNHPEVPHEHTWNNGVRSK